MITNRVRAQHSGGYIHLDLDGVKHRLALTVVADGLQGESVWPDLRRVSDRYLVRTTPAHPGGLTVRSLVKKI
jgi:hypothetical protein